MILVVARPGAQCSIMFLYELFNKKRYHKKLHRQKDQILPLKWQKKKTEQRQNWQMIKCTAISIRIYMAF